MLLLDTLPSILACAFLVTAMLSVGLQTTSGDLRSVLASKGFFLRCLLANFVAVPLVGIVLTRILPLKPEAAVALLILACTPGGISALQFTTRLKGVAFFAGISAILLSLVAVFLSPALLALLRPAALPVAIPYGMAALVIVGFHLLPLLAGVLLRSRQELLAVKLSKVCAILSLVFFVVVLGLLMKMRKEAMNAVGMEAILYMLLFILISMAVGWLLGGPAKATRGVLATVTGMRHAGLCLLIALHAFPDPAVQSYLLAFSALMIPPNMLLTVYLLVSSRKGAGSSQNPCAQSLPEQKRS